MRAPTGRNPVGGTSVIDLGQRHDRSPAPPGGSPAWRITAATATGISHRQRGRGNDDAFGCASRRDGALLLAVADGAGSAAHAAAGARLAVDAALAALSAAEGGGWRSRCAATVSRVRRRLADHAAREGIALRDYACTLLLIEVADGTVRAGQIGDGAVVVQRSGALLRPTAPGRGTHVGETVFVTGRDAVARLAVATAPLEGVEGIALLSDGLEPVALQGDAPFGPFFDPLFAFAAGDRPSAERSRLLTDFLTSDRIVSRSHDDLTLLLAAPR